MDLLELSTGYPDLQKVTVLSNPQGQRKQLLPFGNCKFPENTASGRETCPGPLCMAFPHSPRTRPYAV